MNEQQPATITDEGAAQRGIDRRKFLLGTGAVTAGAWAAPSILTVDRAFGATGSPCEPGCATTTDAATVKGTVVLAGAVPINVRENACLNDDTPGTTVALPGSLGSVTALAVSCECNASVTTAFVNLNLPGVPLTAAALESNAACDCGEPTGGSRVLGLTVAGTTVVESTTFEEIPLPGLGFVRLNEGPADGAAPGEFNAVHIFINDPILNNLIDLKLASSQVTCA